MKPSAEHTDSPAALVGRGVLRARWGLLVALTLTVVLAFAMIRSRFDRVGLEANAGGDLAHREAPSSASLALGEASSAAAPDPSTVSNPSAISAPSSSPEPEIPPTDRELYDPLPEEHGGLFSKAYTEWANEMEDPGATDDARRLFHTAFTTLGIHPEAEYIRCGDALCRARFRYETLKELYRMLEIDQPDGIRVATTFPVDEAGSQTVSIYWTRKADPEGPLTETVGR